MTRLVRALALGVGAVTGTGNVVIAQAPVDSDVTVDIMAPALTRAAAEDDLRLT